MLRINTPRVFQPLLAPKRYKGAYGGRGSGKSHHFAEALVEQALIQSVWPKGEGMFAVCIREVQLSLKESCKRLVENKIQQLGVGRMFEVFTDRIDTPNGGQIIFRGMQSYNAETIKSLEGYDVAWIEEAQSLSQRSLDLLRPTIRKEDRGPDRLDSEIWASWNPDKDTDPVDMFFRGPNRFGPDELSVVESNYADNPFFPRVLQRELEHDKVTDYDKYRHVWLGEYQTRSNALIFKNRVEVTAFEEPYDVDRFFYGADWGFSNDPTVLTRAYIRDDCLWVTHAQYGYHVELDETAQLFDAVPGSRRWPIKADNSQPMVISYMARQVNEDGDTFDISGAEKWAGSIEDGIQHLKAFKKIYIHERCTELIDEANRYSYKVDPKQVDAQGQPVILPIIVDRWNHGWDALRYSLDGYITHGDVDLGEFIRAYG